MVKTTISCGVYLDDLFEGSIEVEELSDDELMTCVKEAEKRGLKSPVTARHLIIRAKDEIGSGNAALAIELLESALTPPDPKAAKKYQAWLDSGGNQKGGAAS